MTEIGTKVSDRAKGNACIRVSRKNWHGGFYRTADGSERDGSQNLETSAIPPAMSAPPSPSGSSGLKPLIIRYQFAWALPAKVKRIRWLTQRRAPGIPDL